MMNDEHPVTELELTLAIRTLALREEQVLADDLATELDHYFGHVPGLDKRVDAVLARYREARR
jgi:hypothetical protein